MSEQKKSKPPSLLSVTARLRRTHAMVSIGVVASLVFGGVVMALPAPRKDTNGLPRRSPDLQRQPSPTARW